MTAVPRTEPVADPVIERVVGATVEPTVEPTAEPTAEPDPRSRDTRVLYLGGTGRSGSTILANVLGSLPGLVSVGELRFVWQRGIVEDRPCGCGQPFSACPFWNDVLARALDSEAARHRVALATHLHAQLTRRTRLRTLPRHLATQRLGVSLPERRVDLEGERHGGLDAEIDTELDSVLAALYRSIREVSGAEVVVDSSKLPTYLAVLAGLEGIDPSVLHLVRDPRAAAYSWRRDKPLPELGAEASMERRGAVRSAILWSTWNRALEALVGDAMPYTRIGYEEVLGDPVAWVDELVARLGLAGVPEGFFEPPDTVRLAVSHTVAGNPVRHRTGPVALRLDEDWRQEMRPSDRRVVTVLTRATAHRYGYR